MFGHRRLCPNSQIHTHKGKLQHPPANYELEFAVSAQLLWKELIK